MGYWHQSINLIKTDILYLINEKYAIKTKNCSELFPYPGKNNRIHSEKIMNKLQYLKIPKNLMMMKELILASDNLGKLKELQELLTPIHCIGQGSLGISSIEETGLSFVENALIKARHACLLTQKPALADDSGLVVPALQGEPGIYSARYASQDASDEDNIRLLLKNMAHLGEEQRHAYFYCALVLVQYPKDPTPVISTGMLHGTITLEATGAQGFGYDPIFYIQSHQCTLAQLPAAIKNTLSHRAMALSQLRKNMATML